MEARSWKEHGTQLPSRCRGTRRARAPAPSLGDLGATRPRQRSPCAPHPDPRSPPCAWRAGSSAWRGTGRRGSRCAASPPASRPAPAPSGAGRAAAAAPAGWGQAQPEDTALTRGHHRPHPHHSPATCAREVTSPRGSAALSNLTAAHVRRLGSRREQEGAQQSAAFPSRPFCFWFTEQPREHTKRLLSAAEARKVG